MRNHFVFVTILLAYFLIVFGGYVASSESGMGCGPEWPFCNGDIIPDLHGETLIEFGHRFIGAILFLFTIIVFVSVKRNTTDQKLRTWANWMLGLFVLQLIMGAIVVFYHLPPSMITLHLLISLIYLAILIGFWRHSIGKPPLENETWIKKHLTVTGLFVQLTIVIGAYIKHQDYGLSCGYLTCGESLLPRTLPAILQTLHRLFALASMLYIFIITYKVWSWRSIYLKSRMMIASIVVLLQLVIGIFTITSNISIPVTVLHLAAATLLFAIIADVRIIVR